MKNIDHDEILEALARYDRQPFRDVLAAFLEAFKSMDADALAAWAAKTPDRWAQALAILGRLSGFTEKSEVVHSNLVIISQLSDHQLIQRLKELENKMQAIDITEESQSNV